jgi:hypothetical protein
MRTQGLRSFQPWATVNHGQVQPTKSSQTRKVYRFKTITPALFSAAPSLSTNGTLSFTYGNQCQWRGAYHGDALRTTAAPPRADRTPALLRAFTIHRCRRLMIRRASSKGPALRFNLDAGATDPWWAGPRQSAPARLNEACADLELYGY